MSKNIFATITHVAEKITEAITGHKNDEQAHPQISEQINVLSANKLDTMIEKPNQSLNQDLAFGTYHFQNATDGFPEGYTQDNDFVVCVYPSGKLNLNYQRRVLYDIRSDKIFSYRKFATSTSWNQLATTTKTDISFPFTGSYMSRGGYVSKVTKDAMGLVTINVTFQINDGSTLLPQGNNIIGTLPVGYRPQGIVAGVGSTAFGGNMVNVRVTVGSDGVVTCTTGNGYTGSNVIGFSISYYV